MAFGIAASASLSAASGALSGHACQVTPTVFEGWKAQQISNDWVRLTIVPQLGGRLMQVSFGGHDFLFVNPKYKGKYISPAEAAGRWINYGGDKIWPMPEGNEDEHHWVLKSDPLDDGEYAYRITSQGERCAALLEGLSRSRYRAAVLARNRYRCRFSRHFISRGDEERRQPPDYVVSAIGHAV